MPKVRDINLNELDSSISSEMIEEYKKLIQAADLKNVARELTFEEGESIHRGREALALAGKQLGIYLKITKKRGQDVLIFREISKKEHSEMEKARTERAERMREAKASKQ